jgi:hypothetical protein
MIRSPALKQALRWFGIALAIAGVIFVILRLKDLNEGIDIARFDVTTWLGLTAFSLIYGLANLMLALAWWNLLEYLGVVVSRRWAIKTYGMTQLAKYAPGNILHFAGRQATGVAAGLPGWPVAKSAVGELGLLSVSGGLFAILALPRWLPLFGVTWAKIAFALTVGSIAFAMRRYGSKATARAFAWHCGFLASSGVIFVGVVYLLADRPYSLPWAELCGGYVLAWLVGLVTPGAPAGVGVREMTLLLLFGGAIKEADLLMAVVLSRMVTVVGDLGFFGLASLLKE